MSLYTHIFSENIKEIEALIREKFSNDLKTSLGHDNVDFKIDKILIDKANMLSVNILVDQREVVSDREINHLGVNERRIVKENDIQIFSYDREDYSLNNIDVTSEFRIKDTNETEICCSCNGRKSITCYSCSGSGRNRCSDCKGQRQVKCKRCYGSGEVNCNMIFGCGGKGYTTSYENGRNIQKRCSSCNGRGKDPCSSCSNGYITCSGCNGNGDISCHSCNSRGEVDCDSCNAVGSFTNFFKVNSILKVIEDNLIIKGNQKKEFISRRITEEDFIYENSFINYKLNQLKEYSNDLKEITSRLKLKENQLFHSIYFSLDELASFSFQVIINDSVYEGGLKNGEIWINPSIINLLFYDIIDGINIDKRFSNILSNKKSIQNNIKDSDKVFPLIVEYNDFDNLITSKDSINSKIHNTRQKKLINVNLYLKNLYSRFILRNSIGLLVLSLIFGLFLYINLDSNLIFQYGYLGIFFIQILAFLLSFIISFSVKKSNPDNLQIIIYLIVLVSGFGNYFYTQDLQNDFESHATYSKYQSVTTQISEEDSKIALTKITEFIPSESNNHSINDTLIKEEIKASDNKKMVPDLFERSVLNNSTQVQVLSADDSRISQIKIMRSERADTLALIFNQIKMIDQIIKNESLTRKSKRKLKKELKRKKKRQLIIESNMEIYDFIYIFSIYRFNESIFPLFIKRNNLNLTIMRNGIFARHGYVFIKDGEMNNYFKSQDWYIPISNQVNNLLTDIERHNIKIIKNFE